MPGGGHGPASGYDGPGRGPGPGSGPGQGHASGYGGPGYARGPGHGAADAAGPGPGPGYAAGPANPDAPAPHDGPVFGAAPGYDGASGHDDAGGHGPVSFRAVPSTTEPQPLAPGRSAPRPPDQPGPARAEDPGRSSPPRGERRPPDSSRPAARVPEPSASAHSDVGVAGRAGGGEVPSAEDAYGPDDPGYGPPDPSWYERRKLEREREREMEEEEFLAEAAEEKPASRGVFEPLARQPGSGATQPTSLDLLLDAGDGIDDADPLDRVKDMYLAAEAVSDTDLDRRFEELLERQQTLISAYFTQSGLARRDATGEARVSVAASGDGRGQR